MKKETLVMLGIAMLALTGCDVKSVPGKYTCTTNQFIYDGQPTENTGTVVIDDNNVDYQSLVQVGNGNFQFAIDNGSVDQPKAVVAYSYKNDGLLGLGEFSVSFTTDAAILMGAPSGKITVVSQGGSVPTGPIVDDQNVVYSCTRD